jgi:hypothetical protein
MPTTREGETVNNLDDAIALYRANAAKLFVEAHDGLPPKPQESAEDNKKRSQGQLQAAFSQLASAETMDSAQRGRAGYADIVKLMATTRITADVICGKLATFAGNLNPAVTQPQAEVELIKLLTAALQALAQISPTAVWQKSSNSDGAAG